MIQVVAICYIMAFTLSYVVNMLSCQYIVYVIHQCSEAIQVMIFSHAFSLVSPLSRHISTIDDEGSLANPVKTAEVSDSSLTFPPKKR